MIINSVLKKGFVFLAGCAAFSGWAHAASDELLNYSFTTGSTATRDWGLSDQLAGKSPGTISVKTDTDGMTLKMGASNIRMTNGDPGWTNYRVSVSGKVLYPCSFEIVGHYSDRPSPAYYFLQIDSGARQVVLGRFLGLKTEVLQKSPLPDDFKTGDFELALEFDGSNIKGYLNDALVCTHADDGRLTGGRVGIIGQYYTNLLLTGVKVTAVGAPGKTGMTDGPAVPRLNGEAIPLSLRNWDLAAASKKKTDFGKPSL